MLPRRRRQEALQEYAQQYADQLAEFVRGAPENWFNFFEFWREDDAPTQGEVAEVGES